jgi:hypothetical protein
MLLMQAHVAIIVSSEHHFLCIKKRAAGAATPAPAPALLPTAASPVSSTAGVEMQGNPHSGLRCRRDAQEGTSSRHLSANMSSDGDTSRVVPGHVPKHGHTVPGKDTRTS